MIFVINIYPKTEFSFDWDNFKKLVWYLPRFVFNPSNPVIAKENWWIGVKALHGK